jgi:hypothetical protein
METSRKVTKIGAFVTIFLVDLRLQTSDLPAVP